MDAASISGVRLVDSSGNHNDGALVGFSQTPSAPGRFDEALTYPGLGTAYVRVPQLALNQTPGGVNSVSMWFFHPIGRISSDVLVLLPDAPRLDLWFAGSKDLCINTGSGDCWGIEDNTLVGRWVHVVAIFVNGPSTKGNLYVDGQSRSLVCVAGRGFQICDGRSATAGSPVILGGESDYPFHGMLDEVRIYNRALSASEVSALYTGTACP